MRELSHSSIRRQASPCYERYVVHAVTTAEASSARVRSRRVVARLAASPPLRIFVWSRLAVWAAAVYAWMWFLPRPSDPPNSHDLGYLTQVWSRWDSGWFAAVAEHGYHAGDGSAA